MNQIYILHNPKAGSGSGKQAVEDLGTKYENVTFVDVCQPGSRADFFAGLDESDKVILCGGDGTLNHFANDVKGIEIKNDVYYYPIGSGNDFARDLGKDRGAEPNFPINEYVQNLPTVTVNGEERVFINGVGYGIDGYCCEMGELLRAKNDTGKPINYTGIAIKGLLFHYKPTGATVTVDGQKYTFDHVWLAPTMHGRFYGGGMMPAPEQDRMSEERKLSVMVFRGRSKIKSLIIFPSLFKGEHVKHKKNVTVLSGKEITVTFDRPTPLQIDGETILNVTSYTAKV